MKQSFYFYEKTEGSQGVLKETEKVVFVDEKGLSPLLCKTVIAVSICVMCLVFFVLYEK